MMTNRATFFSQINSEKYINLLFTFIFLCKPSWKKCDNCKCSIKKQNHAKYHKNNRNTLGTTIKKKTSFRKITDSLKSTCPFRNLFVYLYFSSFQIQNVENPLLTTSHAKMVQLNTVYNRNYLHFVPFFLMS